MSSLNETNQQQLSRFLQRLVQTASFSGMEGSVAQQTAEEMERVGFDAVKIDDMGNVIGQLGTGTGPHLLYFAHMDTVGIGDISAWQKDPFAGIIEHGVLYGRGAANPKAGLASMLYGVKQLQERGVPLKGTLYVVAGVHGEAAEGVAVRYVLEQGGVRPEWVILGAPTNLNVNLGHRGRLEVEVTVQGKACHAATPAQGVNAIYGAARIIFSLELMTATLGNDPFLGPGTLAVTHIENIERTKNVIPDCCTFIIDQRLTLGETEAQALAEVQGLLAKENVAGHVRVATFNAMSYTGKACVERKSYPAWITDENDLLVKAVLKSVQTVRGSKPKLRRWNFSTAGVYTMGHAGIPTVGFGPGDESYAHTADDQVTLQDCYVAASGYAQIASDLLK